MFPSPIVGHLRWLENEAGNFESITEFGVENGFSTIAFLTGGPLKLTSYDLQEYSSWPLLRGFAETMGVEFRLEIGNSVNVEIESTELLCIDSFHSYEHLKTELDMHHEKVLKRIVLHDTVIYGQKGEDGGYGLLLAIEEFCGEHPWKIAKHFVRSNGLTVLERM